MQSPQLLRVIRDISGGYAYWGSVGFFYLGVYYHEMGVNCNARELSASSSDFAHWADREFRFAVIGGVVA